MTGESDRRGLKAVVVVLAVALVLASLSACGPKKGASGCTFKRPKVITITGVLAGHAVQTPPDRARPKPKPKPTKTKERKKNCNKQNSPIWNSYTNTQNGWKTDGTYYYRWDRTHNDIEKYDQHGRHQGSLDPSTGQVYRPRQKTHDLPKSQRNW